MKKVLLVSVLLSVFTLIFAAAVSLADPILISDDPTPTSSAAPSPSPPVSDTSSASPSTQYVYADDAVTVKVLDGDAVETMTMSDYLVGVVAAEMPASFEPEALAAQAVAARTEVLNHMLLYRPSAHPDADICTDYTCCQAYKSIAALRVEWGADYAVYLQKITAAVRATDGICLIYQDEPIEAVFHSSSSGKTEESSAVWDESLPYLVSVMSPETAADVPNYISTVTVSLGDFKQTVVQFFPDAVFPADTNLWIGPVTYTGSGRIDTVQFGGVTVPGTLMRTMFGLRSTAAAIELDDTNVTFTTLGYGHGVGMSQYGANIFAQQGLDYRDILLYYYSGITFGNEIDLLGAA